MDNMYNYYNIEAIPLPSVDVREMIRDTDPDTMRRYIYNLFPDTVMFIEDEDEDTPRQLPVLQRATRQVCDLCTAETFLYHRTCSPDETSVIKKFRLCFDCFDKITINIESREIVKTIQYKSYLNDIIKSGDRFE